MPKPLLSAVAISALTVGCSSVFGEMPAQTAPENRTEMLTRLTDLFEAQQGQSISAGRIRFRVAVPSQRAGQTDAVSTAPRVQPYLQMRALENHARTDMILYPGHFGQSDFAPLKLQLDGVALTLQTGR
jgi:hypothetical protein